MSSAPLVLIIDDDAATVRLLAELLRGRGFLLRVSLDGREGHGLAVEVQPDVILLDVSMPHLDGHHVCRLLKDDPRTRDIPVLFLTGKDGLTDKLEGFDAGGSDYITKPCHRDELVARLRAHVRRRVPGEGGAPAQQLSTPVLPEAADRQERHIRRAMEILRAELAAPPSLVELARRVGSNERRLTELFGAHLGMPVFAWLREERYRQACHLLLTTDWDVGVVAARVGYASSAFASGFRKRYGVTPSHYRQTAGLAASSPKTSE